MGLCVNRAVECEAGGPDPQLSAELADSFESFYRREWDPMVRLAWSLTGQRMVAQEIAQDVMLVAFRNWSRISTYESTHVWIRRVTLHRCTSRFRRASTELRLLPRLARERIFASAPDEALSQIWQAVGRLPVRQREVVALRYLDDMTAASIAEVLEIGEDTVRTHLRRAHDRLATTLAAYAEEYP